MKIKTKTKPYGTDVQRELTVKKHKDKINMRIFNRYRNYPDHPDFAQIYIDRKDIRKLANYMLKVADQLDLAEK